MGSTIRSCGDVLQTCAKLRYAGAEAGYWGTEMAGKWTFDDPSKPLIARMVAWFLEKYGTHLKLGGTGPDALMKATERTGCRISETNWRHLRDGEQQTVRAATRSNLCRFFQLAVRDFQDAWFDLPSLEDFQAAVLQAKPNTYTIPITIRAPSGEHAEIFRSWLPGLYISYRHSFDGNTHGAIAREILYVYRDHQRDDLYRFKVFYVIGSVRPGRPVKQIEGVVIPVGYTVLLIATSENRARSILWQFSEHEATEYDRWCRLGLTMTARGAQGIDQDHAPVTACTVFLKMEHLPTDLERWCSAQHGIIGILPIDEIIRTDFPGPAHEMAKEHSTGVAPEATKTIGGWVQKFLENTPMSVTDLGFPDGALRLNLSRFRAAMPRFHAQLVADPAVVAPYKSNWQPPSEPPATSRTE